MLSAATKWVTTSSDPKTEMGPPPSRGAVLRVHESFLRSLKRRSLRVKRSKSLVIAEKRKSDSFVNSQEWTLSRSVPDLRLGIVGSLSSGKSALVHRYLTGSYMQEESPEGGRFKKEISVDGHSHLLLIRDEGGSPELQFTAWVDAVIFVFSLENEASFNAVYGYYTKMAHYRNSAEIPLILVGTQDAISETNPRIIDDTRARKLAADLKRCSYYETCATYGLNVDRVFQDACQKIIQQRLSASTNCLSDSRCSTPASSSTTPVGLSSVSSSYNHHHLSSPAAGSRGFSQASSPSPPVHGSGGTSPAHHGSGGGSSSVVSAFKESVLRSNLSSTLNRQPLELSIALDNNNVSKTTTFDGLSVPIKDLPTPSSTPTTTRKTRRRSNLFNPSKKDDKNRCLTTSELGSGRAIPLKQGYLYKRSSKGLNKEWKKKYVTLCDDGRLTYHPSLHDYMEDVHGKEISLQYVTVKVPGQKPRGSKTIMSLSTSSSASANHHHSTNGGLSEHLSNISISNFQMKDKRTADKVMLTAFELLKEPSYKNGGSANSDESTIGVSNTSLSVNNGELKAETPNVKKRHRRMKSSNIKNQECEDTDGYEFLIVSLDNKQWQFEANSSEDRDEWVAAIEQQILNSLQSNEIIKVNVGGKFGSSCNRTEDVQNIRTRVPGNGQCADCNYPNPDWASLNLGILMCIECSGVHRNLGSHISKVRSLDLDGWPPSHLKVMMAIGNDLANSVWESNVRTNRTKPSPGSSREEKEQWIRSKYETKEFLPAIAHTPSLSQQLIDAVYRCDMRSLTLVLAHASPDQVNCVVSHRDLRTPLHLACSMINLPIAQLLLWYKANAKSIDHEGRTCVQHVRTACRNGTASIQDAGPLTELLVQNGCPDNSTSTLTRPLDILPSSVI
ncbi:PH domain-like,Small GTPase superfamily,Pleckstrin homology domain,Arf GTPase [Cinara cedri]|uniref:PH domain-like,Small GTPase superfamily,Pleckstrin homology domain,Arf GTPase n=1 Tax=Cinara cedri TaxID=506608 RepID=A0A5E4NID2_9HEMI|nr:PH domain-like,Small GTPase superfamily,Pleckstrin homology domain,Arf GTPase [Cinara cedri]